MKPKELQQEKKKGAEWIAKATPDGTKYYQHTVTNEIRYDDPSRAKADVYESTKAERQARPDVTDPDEMRRVLFSLFRDYGINMDSKWEKTFEELDHDDRFHLVKNIKDRKQIFKEFVNQEKENYKRQLLDKKLNAKKSFKKMIEDYGYITTETKFQSLIPIFNMDPRWHALDDKEKEEAFEEYLEEIFIRENEKQKEIIKIKCEKLKRQMLEIKGVTSSTKWDDIKRILEYNSLWNELHDYYKLKTFSEFITNLRNIEEKQKTEEKEKIERRHRLAYRKFLEEDIKADVITCKTQWSTYIRKIKDEECLYNLIGQEIATPRDIFLDYKEQLIALQRKAKSTFKEMLKSRIELYPVGIDYATFKDTLKSNGFFNSIEDEQVGNSFDYYASYLYKKLNKRHQKAVAKLLKLFYNERVTEKTSLEDMERVMTEHKDYKYFSSLCMNDQLKYLDIYKSHLNDKSKLVELVRNANQKDKKKRFSSKNRSRSSDRSRSRDQLRKRDRSNNSRSSEDIEQGEIRPVKVNKLRPYRRKSYSHSN